jgi:hypothetical protein
VGCARRYRGADDRGSCRQADRDAAAGEPDRGRELPGPPEIDLEPGPAAHAEGPFQSLEQPGSTSRRTPRGTYGLERLLPMGRGHATFIVPLGHEALGGIRRWHDLYNDESGWLDWALSQAALPSVAQIMG